MGQDGFSWFIGVVEDRDDPWRAGRVRVRCLGHHSEDVIDIPTEELPWATPMMPVTAGANSGIGVSPHFLIEGTWVVGFFRDPAKQEPVIMGALPGFNAKATTNQTIASSSEGGGQSTKGGFKDPNGIFPTETYLDKPDTNVLCDGVYTKQHYTYINENDQTDYNYPAAPKSVYSGDYPLKVASAGWTREGREFWWTASSNSIHEPYNTQHKAKYPYNHVLETESGHYVEFDDTPENERIQIHHRKGSFVEINPDGHITISGRGNVTNIVDGNLDTVVYGNYSLTVMGTTDVLSHGKLTELFNDDRLTTIKGKETLEVTGAADLTFKSTLTEEVTGDVTETYNANQKTTITGMLEIDITQTGSIKSKAAMTVGGSSISFN